MNASRGEDEEEEAGDMGGCGVGGWGGTPSAYGWIAQKVESRKEEDKRTEWVLGHFFSSVPGAGTPALGWVAEDSPATMMMLQRGTIR